MTNSMQKARTDTPTVEEGGQILPGAARLDFTVSLDAGTRQIGCIHGQAGFYVLREPGKALTSS
jgi:hypothetical protein